MELVRPLVLSGRLGSSVSSSIAAEYPILQKGATYNPGNRVIYDGYIYLCHTTVTIYNLPDLYLSSFTKEGISNAAAMWDSEISTQTTTTSGNITITMNLVEAVDTVAILNVIGSAATIQVHEYAGGPLLYEQNTSLIGDVAFDWYQYFFFTYADQNTQVVWRGIPPYANSLITIQITAPPVTLGNISVAVGFVVAGSTSNLGLTQYGIQAGILDYSKKETDTTYGTTSFLKRAFSRRMSATLYIDRAQLNRVYRILSDTRAVPSLWIAADEPTLDEAGVVFGFYRDFNLEFNTPTFAVCSIEIEGLT